MHVFIYIYILLGVTASCRISSLIWQYLPRALHHTSKLRRPTMTTPSSSSFCTHPRHHAVGGGGGQLGTIHEPAAETLWNDLIAFKTSESSTRRTDAGVCGSSESIITRVEASSMGSSRFISAVESRVGRVGGESLWVEDAFHRAPSHSEAIVITQGFFFFF